MINAITIQNVASYTSPVTLDDLRKINFIFGPNGSGKTTIGRAIEQVDGHIDCEVHWAGQTPMEVMVYNRDFVERNFNLSSPVRGVFTLGENQVQAEAQIATLRPEVERQSARITALSNQLDGSPEQSGIRQELASLEISFREKAFKQKQKHDDYFQIAFTGARNSAEKFKERVLQETLSNNADLLDLTVLKEKASTIFSSALVFANPLPLISYTNLVSYESNKILQKPIIGSQDVNIAALINQLGNADWVKQGLHFHEQANGTCPFCQQKTSPEFTDELNQFFNQVYQDDLQEVEQLKSNYESATNTLKAIIASVKRIDSQFLNNELFAAEASLLEDLLDRNFGLILNKIQEPSRRLTLESVTDLAEKLSHHITQANIKITNFNLIITNLGQERLKLTAQIWKFVLEELKADISDYQTTKARLEGTIRGMEQSLSEAQNRKRMVEEEIKTLERQSTSIQPTKDAINSLLKVFGFTSFTIEIANEQGQYKISRADGGDARKSLSEGEKTFITFLYFYSLIKGSQTAEGTTTNRVVVFDDPISSLDSDVLYIVSSLIKGVFEEVKSPASNIKQVFVLTHNVYFHKEISFNSRRSGNVPFTEESFWMVKKLSTGTIVERCPENPIKSAYELLWSEVKSVHPSSLTLQNTLRRILENYFTMWGGKGKDEICEMFEGREKLICQSLFSWVNDGSHSVHDDLYINYGTQTNDSYLQVFQRIFVNAGQEGHYNMMMGIETTIPDTVFAA
ncbi:AAA family ATPase [Methylophilus sp. DW102]|uniref:AAA family ATPase n=1 Tax=Methylophilus sp. DW102 TaxID=3095607 RepID=UPI003087226A|nr:AAA family ATPase [Methylophilus sp. DW102]